MKKNSNSLSNLEISAYINNDFEISVDSTYIIDVINDFNNCDNNSISQFIYFPTFGYTHKPFTSKKLNIKNAKNDLACRVTIDKENRKISDSFNTIYCFGGSTTFGWNVSDEHTWPSLLMNSLNKNETQLQTIIKNYGVAGYTATQETNQFIQLIKLGHRPSLCIFMDGYNTGPIWDCSEFTQKTA